MKATDPAFPNAHLDDGRSGMTLLDYFAGQAVMGKAEPFRDLDQRDVEELATRAYSIAQAMIKARKSSKP